MRLKDVRIRGFRRFADLTVTNIAPDARLFVLVGPNGAGKSSFFDALVTFGKNNSGRGQKWDRTYHSRSGVEWGQEALNSVKLSFHDTPNPVQKKLVYARSAYRVEAEFETQQLSRQGDPLDQARSARMIDVDASVSRHYQRLANRIMEEAAGSIDELDPAEAYKTAINEIRGPLTRVFGDLHLEGIGKPLENGTFEFTKGNATNFNFKNLSGGEKAAFDLILDLVLAKTKYDDTLYCIDEPESHLHARLQAELLDVIYGLIPLNCQLMLATHSIGMIRRALEIEREQSGSVCFLDFGARDFDAPQTITPVTPDREFWRSAYDVAIGDLAALVAPNTIVLCEGTPPISSSVTHHSVDAQCYRTVFSGEFPDADFVSVGNDHDVVRDRFELAVSLRQLLSETEIIRVVDGDDRGPAERGRLARHEIRSLSRRNLEHYMYDDEVLMHLAKSHGDESTMQTLLNRKSDIMDGLPEEHRHNLKYAAGQIYNACKDTLGLRNCGNDATAFMYETLAHHVLPGMTVYEELKSDIFEA